jgi:hypothetical protein
MLSKRPFTISLLLRLVVVSTAAHAGSTVTDKSHWPKEAMQSAQDLSGSSLGNLNSVLAYDGSGSSL